MSPRAVTFHGEFSEAERHGMHEKLKRCSANYGKDGYGWHVRYERTASPEYVLWNDAWPTGTILGAKTLGGLQQLIAVLVFF